MMSVVAMRLSGMVLLLALMHVRGERAEQETCEQTSVCTCRSSKGGIDLGPVTTRTSLVIGRGMAYTWYTYSPCKPFTLGQCKSALLCQTSNYNGLNKSVALGDTDNVRFHWIEGDYVIQYSSGRMSAFVTLDCQANATTSALIYLGKIHTFVYNFKLKSPYACSKPEDEDEGEEDSTDLAASSSPTDSAGTYSSTSTGINFTTEPMPHSKDLTESTDVSESPTEIPRGPTTEPSGSSSKTNGPSTKPSGPTTEPSGPTTEPSGPTTEASGSTTKPSGPTAKPSEPATKPSGPTTKPSEPATKTSGPTTKPSGPTTKLNGPTTKPSGPTTKPSGPTTKPSEPATEPSGPTTKPSGPTTKPSGPTTEPSGPTTKPSGPTTKPSEPVTKPSGPTTKPSGPTTKPSGPTTKPSGSTTKPSGPTTKPSGPSVKPSSPMTRPSGPSVKSSGLTTEPIGLSVKPNEPVSQPSYHTSTTPPSTTGDAKRLSLDTVGLGAVAALWLALWATRHRNTVFG